MARTWTLLILSLLSSTAGNVLLKYTMMGLRPAEGLLGLLTALGATPGLWSGLVLFGMGFALWIRVLATEQVSKVYPVAASLTFLLILTASWLIFGERYSPTSLLGVVLIIVGVLLCALDLQRRRPAEL